MYDCETQRPSIDMLEEKIRTCQEQLQLLIECRDRLSAMITFQNVQYCSIWIVENQDNNK